MICIFVCIISETELGSMNVNEIGERGKNTQRKKRGHKEVSMQLNMHLQRRVLENREELKGQKLICSTILHEARLEGRTRN